jgi:soluble lytic murein transglycosylase
VLGKTAVFPGSRGSVALETVSLACTVPHVRKFSGFVLICGQLDSFGRGQAIPTGPSASPIRFRIGDRGARVRAGAQRWLTRICLRGAGCFLVSVALLVSVDAHPHLHAHAKHADAHATHAQAHARHGHHRHRQARAEGRKGRKHGAMAAGKQNATAVPLPTARPARADLPPDLAAAKQAIDLIGQGESLAAAAIEKSTANPVARKLIEWALLRRADGVGFAPYDAFITANPDWPGIPFLRRRAETILWQERADAATVRKFVGGEPSSAIGRLVLARALMSDGDQAGAAREVRSVWRSAPLSAELETAVLKEFPDVLTPADELARMDERIGAKDFGAAMRAAKRLGQNQVAIVKACSAAEAKSSNAGKLLDAVPAQVRDDPGYALCRIHWLLRNDSPGSNIEGRIVTPKEDVALAAKLALAVSPEELGQQDTDEWWRERRALARKLLDLDDAKTAYEVVTKSALPANPYYRAEFHFMAGWIALRFLNDPDSAAKHFALVDEGATDPRILARAAYWRGRAAEAAGQIAQMRTQYEAAARYPTAYYGQLARDRLGLGQPALRPPPRAADPSRNEILQAAGILYTIDERDLALTFVSDMAKESDDVAAIAGLAKLAAQHHDAQATLMVGKTALARGMPMDHYAFPNFGIPAYSAIGPAVDRCIVYAVARTESAFDQNDRSSAEAVGLMQVTPEAGRDTAKRFGVAYNWQRLVSDSIYNTAMGAAEVAALLKEYGGSYILTFAAYNAGRGRVKQWMALHGDPRNPKIDPVDWVERIPFAETRNYVQRVMENLQVYRVRFGSTIAIAAPDLHPDSAPKTEPNLVETLSHRGN